VGKRRPECRESSASEGKDEDQTPARGADVIVMLKRLYANCTPAPHDLVFRTESGGTFDSHNVRNVIRKVGKTIGRPDLTTHGLRHTFINLSFDRDNNTYSVRSIVGHEQVSTTAIYEKANLERLRKVVDSLPNLLLTG
jgi:site-specific recombinase XerD